MKQQEVLGVIRHLLTTFGGGLAASVGFSASEWEMLVGSGLVVVGIFWSVAQKRVAR